jgi:hypothetical protein
MNTILNDMVDSLDETETLDALSKDLVSAAQGVQTNAENITANAEAIATNKTETDAKLTELEQEVIYDVTANNNGATFTSLSALLSDKNLSTLIPSAVRCGGMSIRFVHNSDNKYVQYRLMSDTFNTTVTNWQGVDDKPAVGSDNLVKSGGVFERGLTGFPLVGIAENMYTADVTATGQCYFNTNIKKIVYISRFIDIAHADTVEIDPIDGAIYTCRGKVYKYNVSTQRMDLIVAPILQKLELDNEASPVSSKVVSEKLRNIHLDLGLHGSSVFDYIFIKNPSSGTAEDDADGTRLRLIIKINTPCNIKTHCDYPYMFNIYDSLSNAILAPSKYPVEIITGYDYTTGTLNKTSYASGYLSFSIKKTDNSIITQEDKQEIISNLSFKIYSKGEIYEEMLLSSDYNSFEGVNLENNIINIPG